MLYQITQIADAFDPHAKILCNGSVYNLVWSRFSGFLRLLGDWNGLTALKLLHYYDGQTLSIYFGTIGTTQKYEETTANFVDSFPGDMFGFKKVKHFPDTSKLAQVVNIQRSNVIIPSSVKQCDNPDALKSYYLIRPFEPNASCDHMHLEQTLGFSAVPVALEITLRALDVS